MSKKHSDTDGTETPTERLLREAMLARAMQISAHDLRPAAPPTKRVRHLRSVRTATVSVALFGLAAAVAVGFVGIDTETVADREQVPPAATVAPSVTSTPPPSDAPRAATASGAVTELGVGAGAGADQEEPAGPTPYRFRGVKFELPPGWTAAENGTKVCALPPGVPAQRETSCLPYGVDLTFRNTAEEVTKAIWPVGADLSSLTGWSRQPYCYALENPHGTTADGSPERMTTESRLLAAETLAGDQFALATWRVRCGSGESFTTRVWALEEKQVFVATSGLKDEYEAGLRSLLKSLDISGKPVPPPPAAIAQSLSTRGIGESCNEYVVAADNPGVAVLNRVLAAAKAKDHAKLTELYRADRTVTEAKVAEQQRLWQQDTVLDQLVTVLTRTHLATTDAFVYPGLTALMADCRLRDDLAALGVAEASAYHGVRTSVTDRVAADGSRVFFWTGVTVG